jgi:hypothetical protein
MCPDTCEELFTALDSACAGKSCSYYGVDVEYHQATLVASFQFYDFDGACAEADLTPSEETCDEAFAGFNLEASNGLSREDEVDGMCPDTCEELFTALDSACVGKSYTNLYGVDEEDNQATFVALYQSFLVGACADADLTPGAPGEETCDEAFSPALHSKLLMGFSCTEVDGMCPYTCEELFTVLDFACAGKSCSYYGWDEEYNQATLVASFQFYDFDGACAEADLTPGEETCEEAFAGFNLEASYGLSCEEVDGMCPDTCEELFAALDFVCAGKSYIRYGVDEEDNQATLVASTQFYDFDGTCAEADLTPGEETCDEAFAGFILEASNGLSCEEVDGMCPDTCEELFTALDFVCAGKSYIRYGRDEEYHQATLVASFQFFFFDGACAEADLTPGEETCDEAYAGFNLEALSRFSCEEVDGMCPDTCEELFTALDSACAGKSYIRYGVEQEYNQATLVASSQFLFFDGACAEADLYEETCDEAFAIFSLNALSGTCEEVDGMCPDACEELFTALDSACVGKSYTTLHGVYEEHNQATFVALYQSFLVGACADADLTPGAPGARNLR